MLFIVVHLFIYVISVYVSREPLGVDFISKRQFVELVFAQFIDHSRSQADRMVFISSE